MRKMIKLMFSVMVFALCGFQTIAQAGPMIVMPRVNIPAPVRVAPSAPAVKVSPPPARVTAPKTSQPDNAVSTLVPIMTGIAVMNAANALNSESNNDEMSEESEEDEKE